MRIVAIAAILAVFAFPAAAWASARAPHTPEELAGDREIIRNLNLRELAYVRQRDARWAHQREANHAAQQQYRENYDDYTKQRMTYLGRRQSYEIAMNRFADNRRTYEAKLAAWRRAVAACRAGEKSACAR